MHPYGLEQLAAERQAELRAEAAGSAVRARRLGLWSAATLRAVADWLDGGQRERERRDGPVIHAGRSAARPGG